MQSIISSIINVITFTNSEIMNHENYKAFPFSDESGFRSQKQTNMTMVFCDEQLNYGYIRF